MTPPTLSTPRRSSLLSRAALLALGACLAGGLQAQTDGTWITTTVSTTSWGDATNWQDGQIADGVGATANFTAVQGGVTRTLNINDTDRTVGILNLLNQHSGGTSNQNYTFATTTGQTLTFDNGASVAEFNILLPAYNSGGVNTFSLNLLLGSSLNISNHRPLTSNTLTISGNMEASSAGLKTLTNMGTGLGPVTVTGLIEDGAGQVAVVQNSATSAINLNGVNTYSGGTTILAGLLNANTNDSLGANSGSLTIDGGTFAATASFTTHSSRDVILGAAGGTVRATGFLNVDGVVSGSGTMVKAGTNVLSLNNDANTHTGNILVSEGTLRIRRGDGSLGGAGNSVTLADATTFRVNNFISTSTFELAADRTFTLTSGTVAFLMETDNPMASLITGAGGVSKTGAAVLELKNANTYEGGTVVSAGTLLANNTSGSATGSGAVTVNSGATLGGSGRIAGATTIAAGAFLLPGNSTGVLAFDDALTLLGTSTLEINGTTRGADYDGVDVVGLLTYGGALVLDFGAALEGDATFNLFSLGGGQTGDFSAVSIVGSYAVASLDLTAGVWTGVDDLTTFSFDQGTGVLGVTIIPEPSTYAALAGLAVLGLCLLRRRRRGF